MDTGADTQGVVFAVFEASGTLIKSFDIFGDGLGGSCNRRGDHVANRHVFWRVQPREPFLRQCVCARWTLLVQSSARLFHNRGPMGIDTGFAHVVEYAATGEVLGQTAISTTAGGFFSGSWSPVTFRFRTHALQIRPGIPNAAFEIVRHAYQCLFVDSVTIRTLNAPRVLLRLHGRRGPH